MVTYKTIIFILSIIYAFYLIKITRKLKLHIFQLTWWLIVIFSLLIFGIYPGLIDKIGQIIHIHYPPIFLVIIAILFLLLKLIYMEKFITENEIKTKDLIRKVAILESEIKEMKKNNTKSKVEDGRGKGKKK